MLETTDMLDQLLDEIDKLKEARSLLIKIWHAAYPGGQVTLSPELHFLMMDYFGVDDSE